MNPVDIIVKKRDGGELSAAEIEFFIAGLTDGRIPEYQVAAWAMAVYFQGMSAAETTALTQAMAASGDQLDLHDALPPGTVIVDKHSSGGVGDKTTLAVGPIVAACGLPVGKMSGRGLSFTGGTIDKLESIAGWNPDLSEAQFRRQLAEVGLVIAGQTANLAPADKTLYALRDVTGTVPSLPLIAASIMSKKLAAGADAIVLDVKCGHGAFMETQGDARALAELMVAIGRRAGRQVVALITQMEQPLGRAIGNTLEVQEAIAALQGQGPADFRTLVEAVAVEMLRLGSPERETLDAAQAAARVRGVIASGAALAKFREFVVAQGGDGGQVDDPTRLSAAPVQMIVPTPKGGTVQRVDARGLGLVAVDLGGGRQKKGDPIDHRVGLMLHAKVGDRLEPGAPLCTMHAADEAAGAALHNRVQSAFHLVDTPVEALPVVYERVAASYQGV
ncbi:MAG: thymidine phosphorylase [Caldilineaceae bacterium]|nr:thymidine phosphorylase [Caldilineaceae bacterium]